MKVRINNNQAALSGEPRMLSRADKRSIAKRYGLTMKDVERIFRDATIQNVYETFIEGSKVKLNYDRIMENTEGKSELYLEFVEEYKDDILTIEYDERHKDSPSVFCLAEDTNPVKWLFDISDLVLVEMATPVEVEFDTVSAEEVE
jgi:hypothetical protein